VSTLERVQIREVGPRDGLQPERSLPVEVRADLVTDLAVYAGLREIEAVAFVSPKAVPAMAGAAELMALLRQRRVGGEIPAATRFVALVPNVRGAQLALDAGVDALSVTVSASEGYSQRNVGMSREQAVAQAAEIFAVVGGSVDVDVVVSCAFGSPYEGDLDVVELVRLCELLRPSCTSLTLADTTGMATPRLIRAALAALDPLAVGLHLHETRHTGLLNAFAGLEAGVRRFDTSVGGLGGSPFAAGAAGNVATEELVALLEAEGFATGVALEELCDVARRLGDTLGRRVPSAVAYVGSRAARATVAQSTEG
jgi:hydroxymethylglutaryl-CoA lyase